TMTLSPAAAGDGEAEVAFRLPTGADQEALSPRLAHDEAGGRARGPRRWPAPAWCGRRRAPVAAGPRRDRGADGAAGAEGRADHGGRLRGVRPAIHRALRRPAVLLRRAARRRPALPGG